MIWNSDKFWNKAKLYMRRAFEESRESDRFPLWATLALEFFGRAILTKINPCLVADPQTGENLLYACGFDHATDRPRSVPAKTVFLRIKTITETFTDADFGFVMSLMDRRNEELHSGSSPFTDLPNREWLPKYYRICRLLTDAHDFTLEELFGREEAEAATRVLEQTAEECLGSVKKRIEAYALTFREMDEEQKTTGHEKFERLYLFTRVAKKKIKCPACNSDALMIGEEIKTSKPTLLNDEICQETTVVPTSFRCEVCDLHLNGLPEMHAAELDSQFVVLTSAPVTEFYESDFHDMIQENDYPGGYYEPEYMNS